MCPTVLHYKQRLAFREPHFPHSLSPLLSYARKGRERDRHFFERSNESRVNFMAPFKCVCSPCHLMAQKLHTTLVQFAKRLSIAYPPSSTVINGDPSEQFAPPSPPFALLFCPTLWLNSTQFARSDISGKLIVALHTHTLSISFFHYQNSSVRRLVNGAR